MTDPSGSQGHDVPNQHTSSGPMLNAHLNSALKQYAHPHDWQNPVAAEKYNLVVIGAGPGGLTAAREAARFGAKVALIERDLIGGDRSNVGCISSKTIIRTARLYAEMRNAEGFGGRVPENIGFDFGEVLARMRRIQVRLSHKDSASRLSEAGIDVYFGEASFIGANAISVAGQVLRFKKAIVATGARPMIPDIPGLAEAGYLTNENVFNLALLPRRLMVIGGGPIGCELAQAFCRFGSHVIIAQGGPMFLPGEERDAAQLLSNALARDGVDINLNTSVVAVRVEGHQKIVDLICEGDKSSISVDEIAVGVGRAPNVEGLNLGSAGVRYDTEKGIEVDDFLRTSNSKVYAVGDVCLNLKYAHAAEASATIAVGNALALGRRRLSALTIPWCTYTDPEIAHVGLYVREAREKAIPVKTFTILLHDVDRAVTDGEDEGFVKIHIKDGTDQILGATVVARHAGEMINGLSLAITSNIGLRALARVIHTYPTQAEAIKMAAVAFFRSSKRPAMMSLIRHWLAWQRGLAVNRN